MEKIMPKEIKSSEYCAAENTMKFKELNISESTSPIQFTVMTQENDVPNQTITQDEPVEVNNENTAQPNKSDTWPEQVNAEDCDSQVRPEKFINPHKTNPEEEELTICPFPPILYRKKKGKEDDDGSLYEMRKSEDKDAETPVAGEDGIVKYEPCTYHGLNENKNAICSCQKMQGGQYYDYYLEVKEKEYYTLYPKAICTTLCALPKGAILHFTGAPDYMRREDINEALVVLGANIKFIDYQHGDTEGWVRLSYPYEARVIIKNMTNRKLKIKETDLIFTVLSKKVEKRYLLKTQKNILVAHQKGKKLSKVLKKAGYEV